MNGGWDVSKIHSYTRYNSLEAGVSLTAKPLLVTVQWALGSYIGGNWTKWQAGYAYLRQTELDSWPSSESTQAMTCNSTRKRRL